MKPSALRMQNEKRHIILLHKALQLLSQGVAIHSIFTSHYNTAVLQSGDSCLRFMTRLSQIQVTAVSDSGDGRLRSDRPGGRGSSLRAQEVTGPQRDARRPAGSSTYPRRHRNLSPQASKSIPAGSSIYPRRELNLSPQTAKSTPEDK